jgi:hypothetical protein
MSAITDPELIFSAALQLDNEMAQVFDNASPGWMYETVYTDVESPLVFGGYYGTSSLPLFFPILYLRSISYRDIRPKKTVLTILA